MNDLAAIVKANLDATRREYHDALDAGDTALAERIRLANPDLFTTEGVVLP